MQSKLRAELAAFPHEKPSMDDLNSLKYLDAVVREVLRLYAPVTQTQRQATQDEIIPLKKPFIDRNGVSREEIHVTKGDIICIPVRILNRSKEIWGEDAHELRHGFISLYNKSSG